MKIWRNSPTSTDNNRVPNISTFTKQARPLASPLSEASNWVLLPILKAAPIAPLSTPLSATNRPFSTQLDSCLFSAGRFFNNLNRNSGRIAAAFS